MTKGTKVGILVLAGALLFCVGLFMIGTSTQLFASHFVIYAQFDNVDTLTSGATVRVSGMEAGQVADIRIPQTPSGKFRLKLNVDKKFQPIIRKDSKASIETEGFVGNKYVNIAMGKPGSPQCQPGCTLQSKASVSMGQLMRAGSALMGQVQGTVKHADSAVQNFASVGKNANNMIVAMKPKIEEMTSNASAIVAGVHHGQGAVGKLLTDKTVGKDVVSTISNAKQMSENFAQTSSKVKDMVSSIQQNDIPGIHKTVQNAQQLTGRLNQTIGTFVGSQKKNENMARTFRETINQADQAMGNLAGVTEAAKTNFFLRGFFNRRGFYNMSALTPSKYLASEFVKHPRIRVWIPAAQLFKAGPDGTQALTKSGRAVLDQRMSELVAYLPNNPIMVEGYATNGKPDQKYLRSRERAVEVRSYLVQHFSLQGKDVGFIPLAGQPPKKAGKNTWNGVCLVLVVSKRRHGLF